MANVSENKVRVTNLMGGGGFIGWMDPKVNMNTNFGKILGLDSGNFQVTVGLGTGDYPGKFYPHQLYVTQLEATGNWSYPTGDGAHQFGHHDVFPNGVQQGLGSGMAFEKADGSIFTFGK